MDNFSGKIRLLEQVVFNTLFIRQNIEVKRPNDR